MVNIRSILDGTVPLTVPVYDAELNFWDIPRSPTVFSVQTGDVCRHINNCRFAFAKFLQSLAESIQFRLSYWLRYDVLTLGVLLHPLKFELKLACDPNLPYYCRENAVFNATSFVAVAKIPASNQGG